MSDYYDEFHPGEVIAAERMNALQQKIKGDIRTQSQDAASKIKKVDEAAQAATLDGKSAEQLKAEIIDRVVAQLSEQTGYRMLFRCLEVGKEEPIEHDLGVMPLVDVYQLDFFRVVCRSEVEGLVPRWALFYIYHGTDEKSIRSKNGWILTENPEQPAFRIEFTQLVERYRPALGAVMGSDWSQKHFDDMLDDLWKAFLGDYHRKVDPRFYCHSPWFDERCCKERMPVSAAQQYWDNLKVQLMPRKTINYTPSTASSGDLPPTLSPTQIQVSHQGFSKLGLTLLTRPTYPRDLVNNIDEELGLNIGNQLNVMVLLKA